jgi:hypothetical protein
MVATIRTITRVNATSTRAKVSRRLGDALGISDGRSKGSPLDPFKVAELEAESNKDESGSIPKDLVGNK